MTLTPSAPIIKFSFGVGQSSLFFFFFFFGGGAALAAGGGTPPIFFSSMLLIIQFFRHHPKGGNAAPQRWIVVFPPSRSMDCEGRRGGKRKPWKAKRVAAGV